MPAPLPLRNDHPLLLNWLGLTGLTPVDRQRVESSARRANATHFRLLAWVVLVLFSLFFAGTLSGFLVGPESTLWPFYLVLFGTALVVSIGAVTVWSVLPQAGGQGLYITAILVCVVGLNWLGMAKTGDHSIFLLGLTLTALLYSAPLVWYVVVFTAAWAVSVAGTFVLFSGPQAWSHAVVLTSMAGPALLTALLFEARRIRTEALTLQLEVQNQALKEDSFRDPLTKLYNRRFLMEWLDTQAARMDRQERPLCLAVLDIDHFKKVNDTAGHGVGDEVLRAMASRLAVSLRRVDVVSRYGGEEFVVVLPDTALQDAEEILGRCLQTFRDQAVPVWGKPVTFSAGLARRQPSEPPEALIGRADALLYQAKAQGRNRIVTAP